MTGVVPFFVADRPMSLRLLKGLPLEAYPQARFGIMAHANTTANFQEAFRKYPCDNLDHCDAIGGPCQHRGVQSRCPARQRILNQTIKMCDPGMFTREGVMLTYDELFTTYAHMGVVYGIMIDVFRDAQATIESAKDALRAYKPFEGMFHLVAVAQGNTAEEYVECYEALKQLGFTHIAVGGLLSRRENTVRFPYVRSENLMSQVLTELRFRYPNDWLFALGSFHPNRLLDLKKLNVWADYKGWIFQYEKRNKTLIKHLHLLASNHLEHVDSHDLIGQALILQQIIVDREDLVTQQETCMQKLFAGRKALRTALQKLYVELQATATAADMLARFRSLTTHGLLDPAEEKLVREACRILGKGDTKEARDLFENIDDNRRLNAELKSTEGKINQANIQLVEDISKLLARTDLLTQDINQLCSTIVTLIGKPEREYRFEQVHAEISQLILAVL